MHHPLISIRRAPVAQLDRASDYGSEGLKFESSRVRHIFRNLSPFSNHGGTRSGERWRTLLQITSHGSVGKIHDRKTMNYSIATILAFIAIIFVLITYITS